MKYALALVGLTTCVLMSCSTPNPQLPNETKSTNTESTLEHKNTTTTPQGKEEQTKKMELAQTAKKLLKKTSFIEFKEECRYYRCGSALQVDTQGNPQRTITPPKGYALLQVDTLPKDYVLLVKDTLVFTYQPSTGKITPFTRDDTKKQLSLKENQSIFAREAFDREGEYLLALFSFEKSFDTGGEESDHTKNIQLQELFQYSSTKDTLSALTVPNIKNVFPAPTEYSYGIEDSELLYNSTEKTLLTWSYINHDVYRGLIGEPSMSKAPVRLYNMITGESKVLLKGKENTIEYVAPTRDGKIISFTYGEENKSLGASLKLALMRSLIVTDIATKNPTTTQYTLSPEVQKYLSQYEDMNMENNPALVFEYGFTSGSISPDAIALHGLSHDLLLTLKGKTVVKAEITSAQN